MECLRFDEFTHEEIVFTCSLHLFVILPFYVALEIKEVFRTFKFPIIVISIVVIVRIFSFIIKLFLFLICSIELNIVVDCHKQEVKEELLDAQLGICPILFIELLVKLALAETLGLAVLVFSAKRCQSSIFFIHDVFETGEQIVTKG